uniref:Uncharacterized protein n=1 Tax=Acrobeloides nanus TaxID=290746 RepID=A0A914CR85_9BILA
MAILVLIFFANCADTAEKRSGGESKEVVTNGESREGQNSEDADTGIDTDEEPESRERTSERKGNSERGKEQAREGNSKRGKGTAVKESGRGKRTVRRGRSRTFKCFGWNIDMTQALWNVIVQNPLPISLALVDLVDILLKNDLSQLDIVRAIILCLIVFETLASAAIRRISSVH